MAFFLHILNALWVGICFRSIPCLQKGPRGFFTIVLAKLLELCHGVTAAFLQVLTEHPHGG